MTAIINEAIGYLNQLPEAELINATEYLKRLTEKKHPLEITSKEELYKKIEAGLDDMKNGRSKPFDEVMLELRQNIIQRKEETAKGFGALSHGANPNLWEQEKNAWERAVIEKYDTH